MYSFKDDGGYINLYIDKADGRKKAITTFSNRQSGKAFLFNVVEQFRLCQKLTGLYKTDSSCFNYNIEECNGACLQEESYEVYNVRVQELITKYSYDNKKHGNYRSWSRS